MCLDLVDHRLDFTETAQVDEAVGIEIAHADCTHEAFAVRIFHGTPSAVVVAERLVYQQQVNVVSAQTAKALADALRSLSLTGIAYPHFSGQENLVTSYAAAGKCLTHLSLVEICLCSVDTAVADLNSLAHAPLCVFGSDLEHAVAQYRHLHSVGKFYCIHNIVFLLLGLFI